MKPTKSLVAVLTYRRLHALKTMMQGLQTHCSAYATAVFEDCGQRDETADWLQQGREAIHVPELMATEYVPKLDAAPDDVNAYNARFFLGDRNLGVAKNSNRAIRHFLHGDWDHLVLCNDDLHVDGDFVKLYAKAHDDLGVGMFCFTDFTDESYKYTIVPWRGYKVKLMSRFTGIMISMTRSLVEQIGGFDASFGRFGEEHCDLTIRARMAGGITLDKQPMNCLDIDHNFLRHQDVQTSVVGPIRAVEDREASRVMAECSHAYNYRHFYRPPELYRPRVVGAYHGRGVPYVQLEQAGYRRVTQLV